MTTYTIYIREAADQSKVRVTDPKSILISDKTIVNFNFRTPGTESSMAENLFVKEPHTTVYYGKKELIIVLEDADITVRMDDPYKGKGVWKNGKWAREQAWEAIRENLNPEDWVELIKGILKVGNAQGQQDLKETFRRMMLS